MKFELWLEDAESQFQDDSIQDAKNQSYKSREILISMNISDFLKMAAPLESPSSDKFNNAQELLNKNIKFNSVPLLAFEHNGKGIAKVVSHEGRHRALVLQKAGYDTMPVKLISYSSSQGEAIRWKNQFGYDKLNGDCPKILIGENGKDRIPFPVSQSITT